MIFPSSVTKTLIERQIQELDAYIIKRNQEDTYRFTFFPFGCTKADKIQTADSLKFLLQSINAKGDVDLSTTLQNTLDQQIDSNNLKILTDGRLGEIYKRVICVSNNTIFPEPESFNKPIFIQRNIGFNYRYYTSRISEIKDNEETMLFSMKGLCPDVVDYILDHIYKNNRDVYAQVMYDRYSKTLFCPISSQDKRAFEAIKSGGQAFFYQTTGAFSDAGIPGRPGEERLYLSCET